LEDGGHPCHQKRLTYLQNYTDTTSAGFVFVNNVVSTSEQQLFFISYPWDPTAVVDHNLYYTTSPIWRFGYINGTYYGSFATWQTGSTRDTRSLATNPLLADPAVADFRLQAGSPAIDRGVVVAGVTDGYAGSAPDIGAQERGL